MTSSPTPPKFYAVCSGRYGSDVGFAYAAKKAGIPVCGFARHRTSYSVFELQERAAYIYKEFGLIELTDTKHEAVDKKNALQSTTLIVIMRGESVPGKLGQWLVDHTGGRAMRTDAYFLRREYVLPRYCEDSYGPLPSEDGRVCRGSAAHGTTQNASYCVHTREDDPRSLLRGSVLEVLSRAIESVPEGGGLMVSGPSEDSLPGIADATEEAFTRVFEKRAREAGK